MPSTLDRPDAGSVLDLPAHNVPAALTSFVGRDHDLGCLATLIAEHRLLTVAGPGGVGKTRLVREVAERALAAGGRVRWVDLTSLPTGGDPAPALAAVLGVVPTTGNGATLEALVAAIGRQPLLVVLDNCEQAVDACAGLADALLRRCPGLAVVATSREALGVDGEVVWPLAGLGSEEGTRLFADRARAAQPGFALGAGNADAVAAIAARLDGLPLALELAAATVATFGVEGVAARLDDALAVLARGRRTAHPRHRTLRALLDWSWALLAADEQALLARLGVFRAPFPLDAVVAVAGVGADGALAALRGLVAHSLVEVREDGGGVRYRLLETARQYAAARLAERPDDARAAEAAHEAWEAARTAREAATVAPLPVARVAAPVVVAAPAPVDATPAIATPAIAAPFEAAADAPVLQVLACGALTVVRDGLTLTGVDLTPSKLRELLLFLVLHPGRTKEQIGAALWPDLTPAQLRNAFHVTLHHLRRALGSKDAVAFDGRGYTLAAQAPALDCDVQAVLAAASAAVRADREATQRGGRGAASTDAVGADARTLAAWRTALDRTARGVLGEGAEAEWLLPHRARLQAAWGDGMEAVARLQVRRGAPGEAAATLEALVAADPLREGAHRVLMACWDAAGEPSRALAHYDALVTRLADEVGVRPARDTQALAASIRRTAAGQAAAA